MADPCDPNTDPGCAEPEADDGTAFARALDDEMKANLPAPGPERIEIEVKGEPVSIPVRQRPAIDWDAELNTLMATGWLKQGSIDPAEIRVLPPADGYRAMREALHRITGPAHETCDPGTQPGGVIMEVAGVDGVPTVHTVEAPVPLSCLFGELGRDPHVREVKILGIDGPTLSA